MFRTCLGRTMGAAMLMVASSTSVMAADDHAFGQVVFDTVDGGQASLSDYRGQIVILNLWAVWCSSCLMEIPHLIALQDELDAADATVIGLAIDSGSASAITRFWQRRMGMAPNFPLWMGTAEQAREHFDARTFPTTLIIDRQGQLRQTLVGLKTVDDFRHALDGLD